MLADSELLHAADGPMRRLLARGTTLATAESVTGGGFHYYCTSVPDSSQVIVGGANVYTATAKTHFTGVPGSFLEEHTTVSPETSLALARGISIRLKTQLGMAVTGYAGPAGGDTRSPIGRCYWALTEGVNFWMSQHDFAGDRQEVRQQAIVAGFALLSEWLDRQEGA